MTRKNYDLAVVGGGPAGLMAARTAAKDGLHVLLMEKKKNISRVKRYCSQLIRVGSGGFSSAKKPTDMEIKSTQSNYKLISLSIQDHSKNEITNHTRSKW